MTQPFDTERLPVNTMTPPAAHTEGGMPPAAGSGGSPATPPRSTGPNPWKVATLIVGSVIAVGAILSVAFTGFIGGTFDHTQSSVTVKENVTSVTVSAAVSDIRVEESSGITQPEVSYGTSGFGRKDDANGRINIDVVNGELRVIVPERAERFWGGGHVSDIRVVLPAGTSELDGITVNGNVGTVRIATSATDVEVTTQVGDIRIEATTVPENIRAVTEVGSIRVEVPSGTYNATADSDVGSARVTGIVNDPSSSNIIRLTSNVGDVRLETAN